MGGRLAPVIAICYMYTTFERTAISQFKENNVSLQPIGWIRYIDDIFTIWNHGIDKLNNFLDYLNNLTANIKFTIETNLEKPLAYLRSELRIQGTRIMTGWYRKNSYKDTFLHYLSHHPKQMKLNVVRNEFKQVRKLCNNDTAIFEAEQALTKILLSNGWPIDLINKLKHIKHPSMTDSTPASDEVNLRDTIENIYNNQSMWPTLNVFQFIEENDLRIIPSVPDGHCLLYSWSNASHIPYKNLLSQVQNECKTNRRMYLDFGFNEDELFRYLHHKIFNLDTVDIMPNILSAATKTNVYIFQQNGNFSVIKIHTAGSNKFILLLRSNNNHYDAIVPQNNMCLNKYKRAKKNTNTNSVHLTIPFITERMSRKIKAAISNTNLEIRLIETPGKTLKEILSTNKSSTNTIFCQKKTCNATDQLRNINCKRRGIIYELTCTQCNSKYIGETGRPLHTRMAEHDRHIRLQHEYQSAMAAHWLHQHPTQCGEPGSHFTIKILDSEISTTKRKIKEAMYIEKFKPKINILKDTVDLRL